MVFPFYMSPHTHTHTHSEGLRAGMLADVTNHHLSDILLENTHTQTHTYTFADSQGKQSLQSV